MPKNGIFKRGFIHEMHHQFVDIKPIMAITVSYGNECLALRDEFNLNRFLKLFYWLYSIWLFCRLLLIL